MITFLTAVAVFITFQCGASIIENRVESDVMPPEPIYYEHNEHGAPNEIPLADLNPKLDSVLERFSELLVSVLEQPWGPGGVPLLYVEDLPEELTSVDPEAPVTAWKRSRYYRRYPWKRQNSRSRTRYEADNRYMCQPSREDVFKLLVALHETRAGNGGGRSINFCNRRRSAGAIFTNIRFLGKK